MYLWRTISRMIGLEAKLPHLESGQIAPGFAIKTYQGKPYNLTDLLLHGPVAVVFFKVSCPVCQFTFPFLQRIYERLDPTNSSVVGVSQDNARDTKDFCEEFGAKFPALLDDSAYSVSNAYGITNVPTVFLVEPDGKIKLECMGFDKVALEKIAAELVLKVSLNAAPLFRPDEIIPAYKPG
jgi:peroxiredoxin